MFTSEAIQRWIRIALYYVWGGLGTYGITVGDSWKSLTASILGFVATAVWTKYGSTVNAMLTEVGKTEGVESVAVQTNPLVIRPVDVITGTPDNVTAKPAS